MEAISEKEKADREQAEKFAVNAVEKKNRVNANEWKKKLVLPSVKRLLLPSVNANMWK